MRIILLDENHSDGVIRGWEVEKIIMIVIGGGREAENMSGKVSNIQRLCL
jgi:hypothetical protein